MTDWTTATMNQWPASVTCPGETLREWFEHNALPLSVAWSVWGIPKPLIMGVLAGTEPITPEVAERLARPTCIPSRFWVALEHNYRAGLAAGLPHVHHQGEQS